jgi:integral membrane sensor domain MASE1
VEATVPAQEGLVARRATLSQLRTRAWRAVRSLIEPRSIFLLALVAVSYGITARLSLLFVLQPQNVAGIWPPAGIALGAFLLNHPRRWPLVVAGVGIAVTVANLASDVPGGMTLGFVLANTVEPLLAAAMLRRAGFTSLGTLRGVGLFAAIGGIGAPMIGGLIGATSSATASGAPFLPTWITWVLANAGGVLAVTPVLLVARLPSALPPVRWPLVGEVTAWRRGSS